MRTMTITLLALFIMVSGLSGLADTAERSPRGPSHKYKRKEKIRKTPKEDKIEEEEEKEEDVVDSEGVLSTKGILLSMLSYESSQGILDYKVNVVEQTSTATTHQTHSVRKELYYLAPTRQLTIKDGIPIYYIDDILFDRKMAQVNLQQLPNETIDDIECYVIRMTPKEKAFEKNIKHYYLAVTDFRKIRIESKQVNADKQTVYVVIDFVYRTVNGEYTLPLRTESRTYDDRDFLLESTTSTFMNWKINMGLTPEFFDEKLQGYKIYGVVK